MEETMIHPETGEVLHRDVRPFSFNFRGRTITVDMPGWYSAKDDDGIFSQEDMKIAGDVLRTLKARHAAKMQENSFAPENFALA